VNLVNAIEISIILFPNSIPVKAPNTQDRYTQYFKPKKHIGTPAKVDKTAFTQRQY